MTLSVSGVVAWAFSQVCFDSWYYGLCTARLYTHPLQLIPLSISGGKDKLMLANQEKQRAFKVKLKRSKHSKTFQNQLPRKPITVIRYISSLRMYRLITFGKIVRSKADISGCFPKSQSGLDLALTWYRGSLRTCSVCAVDVQRVCSVCAVNVQRMWL